MNLVVIIQARPTSTRFPGKIYADLGGTTVLGRVIDAAMRIAHVCNVIVAEPKDFLRDENDVLGRYHDAAWHADADAIVRVTADCPFLDPQVSSLVVERFLQGDVDYASNVYPRRTWPDGLDTEVFSREVLNLAEKHATTPAEREHVTPWIQQYARARDRWANIVLPVDWSWVRLTVDTPEDLAWLRTAIRAPRSS